MEEATPKYKINIALLGRTLSGKTAIFESVTQHTLPRDDQGALKHTHPNCAAHWIKKEQARYHVWLYDFAGDPQCVQMNRLENDFKHAQVYLLFLDVTDKQATQHAKPWLELIQTQAAKGAPIYLMANKTDLPNRVFTTKDCAEYVTQHQLTGYFQTTIKDRAPTLTAITQIAQAVTEQQLQAQQATQTQVQQDALNTLLDKITQVPAYHYLRARGGLDPLPNTLAPNTRPSHKRKRGDIAQFETIVQQKIQAVKDATPDTSPDALKNLLTLLKTPACEVLLTRNSKSGAYRLFGFFSGWRHEGFGRVYKSTTDKHLSIWQQEIKHLEAEYNDTVQSNPAHS